jgi:hypothetical protein
MLCLHNYNVFKNIEGYPGLVKGFPIDSKALSSRRGRILSLSQVLKCPWGGWAEFLSIDNSSERGYFSLTEGPEKIKASERFGPI